MRKKFIVLSLALLLCFSLALPCLADSELLVDDAGLLTVDEADSVRSRLKALSDEFDMDIVIAALDDFPGYDLGEYADDYYDSNGYGRGDDNDGILLIISMAGSDWYVSTCGYAAYAVSDYDINEIADEFLPELSRGEYAEAFGSFIDGCRRCLAADMADSDDYYEQREDFDAEEFFNGINEHRCSGPDPLWIPIAAAIGLVIAFISMTVMKRGMKTVRMNDSAADYIRHGSFRLTENSDLFLYRTVTRTPKPEDDDDDGRGGFGGIHMSGGGSVHGGHGGKF